MNHIPLSPTFVQTLLDCFYIIMYYIFFSGLHATYKYCDKFRLPYNKCGKLVVATNQIEVDRLESLYSRALQNKVPDIKLLDGEKAIQEIEPYCKGLKAIHSPHTGNHE